MRPPSPLVTGCAVVIVLFGVFFLVIWLMH